MSRTRLGTLSCTSHRPQEAKHSLSSSMFRSHLFFILSAISLSSWPLLAKNFTRYSSQDTRPERANQPGRGLTRNVSFFLLFLGLHLKYMEAPRLGVESEMWPPAYTTATAMQDPSLICHLHHSSRQRRILNPLSEARDRTCKLMIPSQIRFHRATTGTPLAIS